MREDEIDTSSMQKLAFEHVASKDDHDPSSVDAITGETSDNRWD
jgi:hypothetical protein